MILHHRLPHLNCLIIWGEDPESSGFLFIKTHPLWLHFLKSDLNLVIIVLIDILFTLFKNLQIRNWKQDVAPTYFII